METEKKLKTLQLFYTCVLADADANFQHFGILDKVSKKKIVEQEFAAKGKFKPLAIRTPQELLTVFSKIFGCIQWYIELIDKTITATGNSCLFCAIAKKMGTSQPFDIYCIHPFK